MEGVRDEDEGAEEADDEEEEEGTAEMEAARSTGGALPQAPAHTHQTRSNVRNENKNNKKKKNIAPKKRQNKFENAS